jgi:uncharacterized protein YdeI (YjbR/CyaY-like superfamily)
MEEVFVKSKKELWIWLKKNYKLKESVWLVHYKLSSGKTDLTRDILVDYLLCFGWIDSLPGKVDELRTKIRISPRNPKSSWSRINLEKIERLTADGQMQKPGQEVIEIAKENGSFYKITPTQKELMEMKKIKEG